MKNIFKKLGFTCLGVAACGTASSLITSTNAQQVVQTMAEIKVNNAIESNKPLIDNVKNQLNALKTEIDKNTYSFHYESTSGVVCNIATKPTHNDACLIEFIMPEGKTKVNAIKVMCGEIDITDKTTLSYSTCRTGHIYIPENIVNGNIKVTINSTKNVSLNLKNDDPQSICLVNNPSYNDGSDLVLEYKVEPGQLFCAEAIGKRIGDNNYSSVKVETKKSDKPDIWNVIISADELSSITDLYIKTRNAIKANSILEIYEKVINQSSLAKIEEDLHGWDFDPCQYSDYMDWCCHVVDDLRKSIKENGDPVDETKLHELRCWMQDHGKIVKPFVDKETLRRNRVIAFETSKTESQLRYNWYIGYNDAQKAIGLVKQNSEKETPTVNYSQFHELDKNKDETAGNVSFNNSNTKFSVASGKHKEGRYIYVPFKVELSTPLDLNTLYSLYPTMTVDYTVHSNYKAFHGHNGNHFLTELYYFGEGEEAKNLKPETFDSDFVDKDPSKWDKNVIWREHFYKGGDHDTEKGNLNMRDKCHNLTTAISKDHSKTLYFGLYVAVRQRPNKYGALGYEMKINPIFSDKNSKLNLTQGKEFYQQSKYFERNNADQNAKEEFSIKNDLANDKAVPQARIKTGMSDITISGFSKNENLRGLFLPVNSTITLPAHTKAKVNVGLNSFISFNRKKSINVWDTRIQDYTSFFNLNPEVVENYFKTNKVNDILIPADDKYADEKRADKITNDILKGCEKFTLKLKADITAVVLITVVAVFTAASILAPCAIPGCIAAIIETVESFLMACIVPTIFLILLISTVLCCLYDSDRHIETLDFIEESQKRGFVQSQYNDNIYKDIELKNDTDQDKTFTFDMAYVNLLEGERQREKPIACDYHISSIVKISDIKKI